MKKRTIIFATVALLLTLTGGCTQVKHGSVEHWPIRLCRPIAIPLAAGLIDHVYFSREALRGAEPSTGGVRLQ